MEFNDCDIDFLEEVDRLEKAYIQQHAQQSAPIQIKPQIVNTPPKPATPIKVSNQNQYKLLQNTTPNKQPAISPKIRQSGNQPNGNNAKTPPPHSYVPSPVDFQLANSQSFALQTTDLHLMNALNETPHAFYDSDNNCYIYPLEDVC